MSLPPNLCQLLSPVNSTIHLARKRFKNGTAEGENERIVINASYENTSFLTARTHSNSLFSDYVTHRKPDQYFQIDIHNVQQILYAAPSSIVRVEVELGCRCISAIWPIPPSCDSLSFSNPCFLRSPVCLSPFAIYSFLSFFPCHKSRQLASRRCRII